MQGKEAFIVRIDEPDFGCEGRDGQTVVYDKVRLTYLDSQEQVEVLIEEKDLLRTGLDEGMRGLFIVEENRAKILPLISIIIPAYNAQEYLAECLDSILIQSMQNFEVIMIDDGSTDRTVEICEAYATEDDRIHLLHQEKSGIGAARNYGMKEARGAYIVFVDADDKLMERSSMEILLSTIMDKQTDIVVGNYSRLWKDTLITANRHEFDALEDTSTRDFRYRGFFTGGILAYVWAKIYSRDFLVQNQICFGGFSYAEDKMFNFECYIKAARYAFLEEDVYIYRKNEHSVSAQYREHACRDWMEIADTLRQGIAMQRVEGISPKQITESEDMVAYTIFFAVFFDCKLEYEHAGRSLGAVKRTLKQYLSYPLAKQMFARLAKRQYIRGIGSRFWKMAMWSFSVAVWLHFYGLLSIGIKLLIDTKIDERLSSTGRERYNKKNKPDRIQSEQIEKKSN